MNIYLNIFFQMCLINRKHLPGLHYAYSLFQPFSVKQITKCKVTISFQLTLKLVHFLNIILISF